MSAYDKYAYKVFASLYEDGWGETMAWIEAYRRTDKKFNHITNK